MHPGLAAEGSIMRLNLLLPILALHFLVRPDEGVWAALGWRWTGWRMVAIAMAGLMLFFAIAVVTQQLLGDPLSTPGRAFRGPLEWALLPGLLFGLTAPAEETMFRGWIQTTLTAAFGGWAGIGGAALLFGLRHLPMDLYVGFAQPAPAAAWVSRLLQLYLGALVFGLVRHWAKSTWASWLMHEGVLVLIVALGVLASR
jgi:membrane protease YdiL (CAAX protease family)